MSSLGKRRIVILCVVLIAAIAAIAVAASMPRGSVSTSADTSSTHPHRYETLAPGAADIEYIAQDFDAPYDGYGHGLDAGSSTDDPSYKGYIGREVSFSKPSGAYDEAFELSMRAPEGYSIRYTTDGSTPTESSPLYSGPILISDADGQYNAMLSEQVISTMKNDGLYGIYVPDQSALAGATVIRARAFDEAGNATDTFQRTYFVGKSIAERYGGVAVASITTDPSNLFDYNTGIFASGAIYDQWKQTPEGQEALATGSFWTAMGNYSMRGDAWERPATIELFDGGDELSFSEDVGIRVKGGTSRASAQKSINVFFRKQYGDRELEYELFDSALTPSGETIGSYDSFTLRNGGTEATAGLKFRDSYLQSLLDGLDIATQSSRPCVVFLNGAFWGVYTLCEKYSDTMIANEYGVDKDNVVMIKDGLVEEGTEDDLELYEELMAFADRDFTQQETWDAFCQIVDVQSWSDYCAAEIYIGNADWFAERNCALWRTRDADGTSYGDARWRWMLYDTEFSSALVPHEGENVKAEYDHFAVAVRNNPLLAATLANPTFRQMFIDSMNTIANENLGYSRAATRLMNYMDVYGPLITDHYVRYHDTGDRMYRRALRKLSDFMERRADFILPIVNEALSDYPAYLAQIMTEMEAEEAEHPTQEIGTEDLIEIEADNQDSDDGGYMIVNDIGVDAEFTEVHRGDNANASNVSPYGNAPESWGAVIDSDSDNATNSNTGGNPNYGNNTTPGNENNSSSYWENTNGNTSGNSNNENENYNSGDDSYEYDELGV